MRNIQVNMGFTADTTQAQNAIQQLQTSLQSIATTKVNVQGGSIDQAVQSAKQLSQHLAAATNVNTGKIDFSALQASLKSANTDLTTLTNNLLVMGPKGQQAFSQVANAVAHAELSVKKTNSALAAFGVTLMNTIKWQAASSMIHGAMSAFSDAVSHIEKLDKALNNIQIVSGKTSKEMASFAKRAQELSKTLSSTTEEYSKAALIYYQQGLGEKEILERTEATIKMAKITGDAVATVSDQLTAIWNNFDDGSKSLEYYVDVITALGAATASSTDEISDGLQKFAAIAETVGLSYEYAATALATITAETRQSADVVGTALKTLFARMEGLKLGETLEDGTTLNQYSQAMAKVGINIKDANGNLKEMDTILNEMGAKWQTLNKDQQVALAQQVGGIRQYNQLIALMDNWDTFKINLEIAEGSEGALEKQFNIYQTSVEASEKALQNAKETLYETLFNSEMLKDFNNGLAEVLEIINRIVESAGGLKGVLQFGGLLILKTLLPHLQGFITNITAQISNVIGLTKQQKIKQVDTLSQTQKKISGQPTGQEERWRGISQSRDYHAQAAANHRGKTGVNLGSSRGDIMKANMHTAAAGVHDKLSSIMDSRIQGREQAIQDHRTKAAWGGAAAAVGKNGIERFAGAVSERWHTARANQMDDDARMSGVTPTSLGIKQSNMPAAPTQQSAIGATQMSTSDMASQISQESAGYTSAILDAKRDMLMVEDQLTEKQRQQYKNYEDQINAENDLLRIARERQLASKDQADESSKAAETAVEMSEQGGEKVGEAAQDKAAKELGLERSLKKSRVAKSKFDSTMRDLDAEEAALGEESDDDDEETKRKRQSIKDRKTQAKKDYDAETSLLKKDMSAIQDRADSISSDAGFAKTVDMGGDATAAMAEKMQKQTGDATASQAAMSSMMGQLTPGDSGVPAVSVENLEKLGALQGQYNADAQVAVDLQGELGTAIGAAATSAKKGTKEYETGNKALKQSGTFAQKYGNEMKAAAKELQKAGELTEDQVKAVEDLVDAGADVELEGMDPKQLEGVQKTLGKVEGGLTKAGAAAGQMADTMATDMASATGATKDTFTAVTAGAQQLATDTANADQQANKLRSTMQQPLPVQPDPYGGLVMGAQGAMQAITGLAMGAQMLQTGLSMAFDPDATGIEKLTSLMMIMQGVQSLMTAAQGMYNVAVGVGNIVQAAAIAIKEKGFVGWIKEIALKGVDTAATLVNAVAKVFNAEASKGLAGVIIGILAAALIIGTIAMVANTVKTEQNTKAAQKDAEAKEKQAEGAREAAEAAREELDAVLELTKAYEDALKVYEETGEGKEDLKKAAFEAIEAMGLEGHELEILAGNYANLTKRIQEYNAVKAGKAVDASTTSQSASGAAFLAQENVSGTGGLWTTSVGKQKYLTLSLKEDGKTNNSGDALHRWIEANPDTPWQISSDGRLRAPYASSDDIPFLMKEFYRLYDGVAAIATASEQESMAFFSETQEMRDSGSWEKGQELADSYDTHIDTSITAAKATHLTGVTTQTGYNEAFEELVNYVLDVQGITDRNSLEAKQIIEALEKDLAEDETYMDYEIGRRGINSIKEKYGDKAAGQYITEDTKTGKSPLEEWAEANDIDPDEALQLFLKINPQYMDSTAEIDEAMDAMQAYLDGQELIVHYDLLSGAKKAMKEVMTSEDWSAFLTEYKDLFDPTNEKYLGMSFEEFANKSYADRKAILDEAAGNKKTEGLEASGVQAQTNLDTLSSETGKQAYIDQYNADMDAADQKKKDDFTREVKLKYTEEEKAWFTDKTTEGAQKESLDWYLNTATSAEKAELDKWVTENTRFKTSQEYLAAKDEYRAAIEFDGTGAAGGGKKWTYADAGIIDAPRDAEGSYNEALKGAQQAVTANEQEKYLAELERFDEKIETFELDAEEVYNTAEALSEMATSSEDVADALETDSAAAKQAALEITRFNKAVDAIDSNYDGWMESLESENLSDVISATVELKDMYADLLNMDPTDFTSDFLRDTENLALAQKAAAGDAEAYNQLQINSLNEIGKQYGDLASDVVSSLSTIAAIEGIDVGEKLIVGGENNDLATQISTAYDNAVQAALDGGASVAEAKEFAANMINQAGFNITGFGEEMEAHTVTVTGDLPAGWVPQPDGSMTGPDGQPLEGVKWTAEEGGQYTYTQTYMVPKATQFSKTAETFGGKSPKKDGGGGEPKKADKVKKSDVVERYKEINDQLEETRHLMSKTNAEAEGLWGEARFKKMREGVELLKKQNQQLKERMKWSKGYVDEDRTSLDAAASEAGISFTYDDNGYITNYTEQMTWLYNQLDAAINNANADGNATDEEQKEIDKWQKYIDDIESARGDYEDALSQWREDEEAWLENRNKIWQDNFDILSEELELKVQLNTQDLEVLQYFLDKIEDAVYGIAEAFASGKYFENQFANYSANLGLLSNETGDPKTQGFYQNLQDQYRNGDIGLPQYKQGLADMMGMTIENLESLQDLKESMQDFYGDVMEKALEEIAIYTDSMENLNSVLDHYSNILELVGKQDDYTSKNKVLSKKADNLRREIDVQKKLYKEASDDAKHWAQKMNEAEVGSNEYETYKKNWQAAEAAAQESQDAMLSKTQEWAEAMKSIIENELAGFADTLEKSLTGGISFDELMTSMERRSSLQEEYLTTTNKIYETNKLMRTAQQEIDKTSNTAAKRRMAQFISETQQLQNKNKLSQYELDIQQAKYDLLLAEIALEEAQDAKSVVRLQRDAEGNFGYVYTADQNAVADAEQKLADAQNSLYNIGLEGANNYQQKYAETLQESQEAITELTQMWMNGEISSEEEFNRRKQEIVEYYGEKLQQYSDLHSIALTTDSRVVKDAWSSDFSAMTASVDVWKQNVDTYFSQAGESMQDWADVCGQVLEDSGLNKMDETLGEIDQKSKDLKETLIGEDGKSGVVAAMMAEVDAAGQLSEEYIAIQDAIDGVIKEYEDLLKILNEDYQSPTGPGDEDGKQNGEEEEEEEEEEETPDDSTPPPAAAQLSVGSTVKVKTSASKWASGEGIWGPVKGNNFKVMQISGEKVLIGDPCGPNYTASGVTGWIKKTDLEGFDTGGYTGDWSGAYGKLALLHKKELILKEGDTANFLAGMDLLNKIISVIDLQSVNNSLGGLLSSPSLGHVGDEGGILEQQVHIEASFPGVSDHSEIEEAFNNLVNQAAQYANRK